MEESLLKWLCTTPKTTCIRVNLLRTTTDIVSALLLDVFKTNHPSFACPKIFINDEFPEVILIENLNDTDDPLPIPEQKEVVVDVNCAASILRGMRNILTCLRICLKQV